MYGIVGVGTITVLCFLAGVIVKATPLNDKYIPAIVGVVGVGLGVLAFYMKMPDFPAQDVITAAAVGCVSGLASTGADQAYKQMLKRNKKEMEGET